MLTIKVPMLFLGLLLTAAFIAACGDSNSTQEDNKEVVQRFAEEFKNQANHGIVDELMTPGFIHHFTDPRLPPGRDAMKLLGQSIVAGFPDVRALVKSCGNSLPG